MPQTQTLLKDKPYEFVPLVSQCNREFIIVWQSEGIVFTAED